MPRLPLLDRTWKTFNVSIKNNPFTNMPVNADGTLGAAHGLEFKLLQTLADTLKFNTTFFASVDGEWGRHIGNGSWSGALGMVQRNQCDFSICYLSPSYKRLQYFDFSDPYSEDNIVFVTKAPDLQSTEGIYFLKPFTFWLWILWGVVIIVISFFVTLTIRKTETIRNFPIVWFMLSTLLKQSDVCARKLRDVHYVTNRAILLKWLISCTFFALFYGCSLTATVSVAPKDPVIKTVLEMAKAVSDKKYFVGIVEGTFYYELISNAEFEPFTIFKENYKKTFENVSRRQVVNESMAYLTPAKEFKIEAWSKKFYSEVHIIDEYAFSGDIAIAFRKNFAYLRSFNRVITMLSESGVLLKWELTMMYNMSQKSIKDQPLVETPSTMILAQDIETALELYFGLICFAFLVFLLERLHNKKRLQERLLKTRKISKKRRKNKTLTNKKQNNPSNSVIGNYIVSFKVVKLF